MCELVLILRDDGPTDRKIAIPHASVAKASENLASASSGWWPCGDRWPKAFCFDLWPGCPPLLVNGDHLKAATVDPCEAYAKLGASAPDAPGARGG